MSRDTLRREAGLCPHQQADVLGGRGIHLQPQVPEASDDRRRDDRRRGTSRRNAADRRPFRLFVPSGRAINPITKTNWEGTGVTPDVPVPAERALPTAHLAALRQIAADLEERQKDPKRADPGRLHEVEEAIGRLEKELGGHEHKGEKAEVGRDGPAEG